jgi:hypothetical protein
MTSFDLINELNEIISRGEVDTGLKSLSEKIQQYYPWMSLSIAKRVLINWAEQTYKKRKNEI